MTPFSISTATPADYDQLIKIWETSVRATHHFLTEADIKHYKLLIYDYYFDGLKLYYIGTEQDILGFIGLKQDYIQMLFVAPQAMQKGIGKTLINFSIHKHGVSKLDVNEQNTNALAFYKKWDSTLPKDHQVMLQVNRFSSFYGNLLVVNAAIFLF